MEWWLDVVQSFLLTGSALFSIVNPMGGALIFSQVTADRTHAQRLVLARRIGVYAALVMLGALWLGVYVLNFFGITIEALRIAGGLVVATSAWTLLFSSERNEARKQSQAGEAMGSEDVAFFPLTMPLTTGPGTISVAIALGASRPEDPVEFASFALGASTAALAISAAIWLSYGWADWITSLLGSSRVRVIARLAAFLLLCVGVQIMLIGVTDALRIGVADAR
jgi:multiple antibiotic resistance protein